MFGFDPHLVEHLLDTRGDDTWIYLMGERYQLAEGEANLLNDVVRQVVSACM